MGKVLLVASGKGGTGKTMFSVNMGAALAQRGYNVLLIDMDMGLRNMDLYLGMENRVVYNIMDVLSGICRISKAIIRVDGFSSLYFMAAAPRAGAHQADRPIPTAMVTSGVTRISTLVSLLTALPISEAITAMKSTARGPPAPPSALEAKPTVASENSTSGGQWSAYPIATAIAGPLIATASPPTV